MKHTSFREWISTTVMALTAGFLAGMVIRRISTIFSVSDNHPSTNNPKRKRHVKPTEPEKGHGSKGKRISGRVLGQVAAIATVFATAFGITDHLVKTPEREQNRRYQAWQIVTTMEGKRGEGGRKKALADLLNSNVSLSGIVLDEAIITDLDLSGANLERASFRQAILPGIKLPFARLKEASFEGIHLQRAILDHAVLNRVNLDNALIVDSSLSSADLSGIHGQAPVFHRSFFNNVNFANAELELPSFRNAELLGSRFVAVRFNSPDFFKAKMGGATWVDTDIAGGSFLYVVAEGMQIIGSDFKGVNFQRAQLKQLLVNNSSLRNSNLRGAALRGARFENVDLGGVDFTGAELDGTLIDEECNVDGAVFSSLNGLDCINCRIGG